MHLYHLLVTAALAVASGTESVNMIDVGTEKVKKAPIVAILKGVLAWLFQVTNHDSDSSPAPYNMCTTTATSATFDKIYQQRPKKYRAVQSNSDELFAMDIISALLAVEGDNADTSPTLSSSGTNS